MLQRLKRHGERKSLNRAIGDFELPAFPAVAQQVLAIARSPDSSSRAVADAVTQDPGLSTAVLRNVNAAAFGARRQVEDVRQAVALLGVAAVESLVVSVVVGKALPAYPDTDQWRSFWRASVRRAAAARAVAARVNPQSASRCYTSALLCEMAVPFLYRAHPDEYGPMLESWNNNTAHLHELERTRFNWDHAEVATWIGESWELPEPLVDSIATHHEPLDGAGDITRWVAAIRDDGSVPAAMLEAARDQLGLEPETTQELLDASFEDADQLARMFFE